MKTRARVMKNRRTGWLAVAIISILSTVGVSKINRPVPGKALIEGESWTRGKPSEPMPVSEPLLNNQQEYEKQEEARVTEEIVKNTNGLMEGYKIIFTHKYEQTIGNEENQNTKFDYQFSKTTKQGTCIVTTYYKIVPVDPDCWGCPQNRIQLQ